MEYAQQYIKQALTADNLPPPDPKKADGTYEALIGLYMAHQAAGATGAAKSWETLRQMRPDLAAFVVEDLTINITELYKLPSPEHLTTKYPLYEGGFNVLVGDSGSGKSFIALDIALQIAQDSTVVYVAGEGLIGFDARWRAYAQHYNIQSAKVEFYKHHALQVMDDEEMTRFVAGIRAMSPAMVIIDTMARSAVGLDENSAREMGIFIHRVGMLQVELACAVLVVHHTNKGGVMRGSNSLYGASDAVISVHKSDGVIKATNNHDHGGKNKYGPEDWNMFFRLLPVDDGAVLVETEQIIDDPRQTNELTDKQQAILEALEGYENGLSAGIITDATEYSRSTVFRNLKKLMQARYVTYQNDLYAITEDGRQALGLNGGQSW